MFELILFVDNCLVRLFEFEGEREGSNSLVEFFDFCFGDINDILGDCGVFGLVVEGIEFDGLFNFWDGIDFGCGLFCRWIDFCGGMFNLLELIFDFGDGIEVRSGLMDLFDFGIEVVIRFELVFKGLGEGMLIKSSILFVFCFFGGILVGVGGGDKEVGDVVFFWNLLEKCICLLDWCLV